MTKQLPKHDTRHFTFAPRYIGSIKGRWHRLQCRLQATLLVLLLIITASCREQHQPNIGKQLEMRHATLLQIEETDSFTRVSVADCWHPGKTLATYLLVERNRALPHNLPEGTVIRTPLERAALASSVHAALLIDLNAERSIAALADTAYTVSLPIRQLLQKGVHNLGSSERPDIETLCTVKADALLVSPFENAGYGMSERLGIPLIACADYMETSPLGRAEWMRFYGRLVGKGQRADSLFTSIEKSYTTLCKRIAEAQRPRPTVMCDLRTGHIWYQPGGASTMGQLIEDAGGHYLWTERKESGSLPLDLESVFQRARKADIWLVKYGQPHELTYTQMANDTPQYRHFRPWKEKHIWACNTLKVPFYEEVPFRPDRLLQALAALFHPEIVPKPAQPYYTPLH